ncbi:MAG: hypothetical protein PWP37_716 [Thermotogota bacterium]|nr:hypothetical protein [Thermotogota bacterium]HCZ07408.1 hypothetical protein [Thermotogota bacterium]
MKEEEILRERLKKGKISFEEFLLYLHHSREHKDQEFLVIKLKMKRSVLSTIKLPTKEKDKLPQLLSLLLETAGYGFPPESLCSESVPSKMELLVDGEGTKIIVEIDI